MPEISTISTHKLSEKIEQADVRIIDVRSVEAYNGWRLQNESRGGHIKGAISLPYKWSEYIDWIEIVRNKKIRPSHTLIIYGYRSDQSKQIGLQFQKAGYPDVLIYEDFISEWMTDKRKPMDHMKRYQHLVSADWVHELLSTNTAGEYENNRFVICHAHYQNRGAYEKGHIPMAIDLNTNSLESQQTWNIRSFHELKKTFEEHGITKDTTVILYGRFSFPNPNDPFPGSSAGQLAAMRSAFIMLYAGVKDVRTLNGGLESWIDAGYDTTAEECIPNPVSDFGRSNPMHPEFIVNIDEAEQMTRNADENLVSVRSYKEFIGEVSGYNYIEKKGRIPGAVFGNCGTDAYHMQNYRNLDHTTREYHEIETIWSQAGINPDKKNAFYCGTGWRGSEAFMNAWFMGWPKIALFDGGWFEWSNKNKPYELSLIHI